MGSQPLDLNLPMEPTTAIVPIGLVESHVNQLDASSDCSGDSMIETLKRQERYLPNCKIGSDCAGQPPPSTMKILCLNCRGLGQSEAVRELRSLCELHRPWVVFLSETRFFSDRVDGLVSALNMAGGFGVGCYGRGAVLPCCGSKKWR